MDVKELLAKDNFAKLIGAELLEVGEGWAKARMLVTDKHLNGNGVCQGGAIFTLADLTHAAALNSHGINTVSANSNIAFLNPAHKGWLYAEAREIVNHHKLPYAEVKLTEEDGTIVAVLTGNGYRLTQKYKGE